MSASQDYVALDWIKGEIGQTLKQAQQTLEMVAESPDDMGSLRACLTALHQVNGTLQMVQLDGPTQVAREMEDMAQALMNSSVPDVEKAQEVLMQSILQMPAYLDRIQREQADSEANYMPIVNNLRVARGEERIGSSLEEEAKEDLSAFQNPADSESAAAFENGNGVTNVPKLRARYQQALVAVIKKSSVKENLTLIGKVFSMLIKLCGNSPLGNLSRLGLASIEGITSGAIKLDSNSANALKAVDKILKQLSEDGAEGLNQPIPDDLVQSFISVIDGASKDTPKIVDARELYRSKGGGDHTFEEVAIGPDDETLSAVAKILKEELTSVTDKLDLFVRSTARNDNDLVELLPMLEQISSTLVVVGLTQHQETVSGQVAFIKSIKDGEATPDEEHLRDMAGALIEIETSLGILAGDSEGGDGESFGDLNDAQAAVVGETRNGLAKCKDAVIEFVSSDFDHGKLETLSDDLLALRGGLLIANQERSGDVLVAASHYVKQLMAGKVRPELSQMDDLADAITSIDYYLERLLESANDPYIQMIEVAEEAVEKLGFAVGVEPEAVVVEPEESAEVVEDTPETEEQPEPAVAATEVVEDDDDLIDEEILEIFVEEAEEVLETISEYLPQWREDTSDTDALAEVRRAFHTLKGSGRMVGATVVGELAWSIENMLNRVIDNTVSPDDAMLSLIATVTERIPEGVEAFRNQNQDAFEVQEMVGLAEAITNGEAPAAEVEAPAAEVEAPAAEVEVADVEEIELEEIELEVPAAEVVEAPAAEIEEIQLEEIELEETAVEEAVEEIELEEIELEAPAAVEEVAVEVEEVEVDVVEEIELEEIETEAPAAEVVDEPAVEEAVEEIELEEIELEAPAAEVVDEPTVEEAVEEIELEEIELEAPAAEVVDEPTVEEAVEEIELEEIELEAPAAEVIDEPAVEEAVEEIELEEIELEAPAAEVVDEPAVEEAVEEIELEEIELEAPAAEVVDEPAVEEAVEEIELEEIELEAPAAEVVDEPAVEEAVEEIELEEIELEAPAAEVVDEPTVEEAVEEIELEEIELEAPTAEVEEIELEEEPPAEVEEAPTEAEEVEALGTEALLESDDLSLDEIFEIEVKEKIATVREFLESPGTVDGDIAAAFHTLKGSAAMAEIPTINLIAAPLEQVSLDYLGKAPDDWFLTKIRRGASLIEQVINDLDLYREQIPGLEAFTQQFTEEAPESSPGFRFDDIQLLSSVSLEPWSEVDVDGLVAELTHAKEQAEEFEQETLLSLVDGLLSAHEAITDVPESNTVALLQSAYDELLIMFDQIAAGQTVSAPETLSNLQQLGAVEVAEPDEQVTEHPAPSGDMVELPADDIDEDILPIFLEETEELLEGIDESIMNWSEAPDDSGPLDNLLRHLHTLKGGSRMAGINSLGEYTHNFETFLIGVQSNPVPFDETFFGTLNQQQDEITRRVEIYQRLALGQAAEDELDAMRFSQPIGAPAAAVVAPAAAVVAPAAEVVAPAADVVEAAADVVAPAAEVEEVVELPPDDVDEDILPIFLEETEELLEGIDESIQGWSESPDNSEPLDLLLRHLHTLKGGSRMAGLNSLGEYTHNFETYLIGIQSNPIELNEQFFASLNQQQDEITRRVGIYTRLAAGEASEEDLASLLTSKEPASEQATPAPQSTDEPPAQEPEKAASAAPATQEMVRVSADLLEELIGLAGESSINRGRVEQQISDFGDAIQEMEDTINRVRDQVRRLEIEAESRETLISQHGEGDSSFDELEMDRYTMLQEISRTLNESSSDMLDLKDTLVNRSRDAETLLHQQARIASELQEGLTRTRMVPFARLIPRLRRIVRQVSGEIGKSVRFDAFNVEGELDRSVLDRITAPLEHMLRNAVDHGIESAEKRAEAGKPDQGRISLRLSREGGYVILTISDDGGGINVDAVRAKAIDRGLITEGSDVSDHEVMQFIMHAGFSTAQKLTQISGRGVGMDVVGSEIKALGGSMSIDSTLGVGSEFTIRIPFTVSINRALMVVVKEETYAVPLNTIHGIHRVSPYELEAYYQPDAPPIEIFGEPYRLEYLGSMLDQSHQPNLEGQVAPLPVILASSGDNAVALQVDRVIGSREVVVKTLGPQFSEVGGISGATILGDGSVVIILDVMALVRSHEAGQPIELAQIEAEPEPEPSVRTVMIVDDSVTVRKVTSRLMERQGWDVVTAKDGLDAVTQLQDIYPDIVLLDIEMPKMDGFEVLRRARADERLKNLPIIMITSRTGEKHQQQALELGVNKFLGKPFQEANLLSTIEEVIGGG